jgi:hypothetical protein
MALRAVYNRTGNSRRRRLLSGDGERGEVLMGIPLVIVNLSGTARS